jgi:BirA family biotin operon repressor/biotin-[acetyl-CoA-carboxylase] ligase
MSHLYFDSLPSTQDHAMECVRANRRDVLSVQAGQQTAGRGRRAADWYSPPGTCLAISYILWDRPIPDRPWVLGLAMAVAAADALEALGTAPMLRWPNDVLVDGKKVGGILVETAHAENGQTVAVIGVGVNCNVAFFPKELADKATSLVLASGQSHDVGTVETSIWSNFGRTPLDLGAIVERFRSMDATIGQRYSAPEGRIGTAVGIDDEGFLLLRTEDGFVSAVPSAHHL